jgi:pimeloyl-ACP methyl ester carboxylesterase
MSRLTTGTAPGPAGRLGLRRMEAEGQKRGELLFVHGAWSSSWYWEEHFMPFFATAGFDTVALNLRGHGDSESRLRRATINGYVDDVATVAATLTNPVIVGHSMGGLIAQHYAARHPVRGLALLASVPPWGAWSALWSVVRESPAKLIACTLAFDLKPIVADRDLARRLLFSREPSVRDMDHLLHHLGSESYLAFLGMLFQRVTRSLPDHMPRFVLGADRDALFPPATVRATARALKTEAHLIPETSHMLTVEHRWRDAAEAMLVWLDGYIPARPTADPDDPAARTNLDAR